MAALDLRGRAVITDGATATLRNIRGQLDAVASSTSRLRAASNAVQSLGANLRNVGAAVGTGAASASFAVKRLIDTTRDFHESKFGYGFARLTDYMKDGRLDMQAWRRDMDATAKASQAAAQKLGTLPEVTMRAREEVEKLGFKGGEAQSIFGAAVGLHLSEPRALASGEAAKYMGAVYRAYAKQREELAAKLGKDAQDPAFVESYIKGLAAKAAVAGAESALGPADVVEGMRQFAPQWAAMGVSYEMGLAALAHGANYGFRAPELGTAFKSMMTKIIKPSAEGLQTLNLLGIDRSQYMTSAPVAPGKAATAINSLLGGALGGKGWHKRKATLQSMLDTAYKSGETGTPEFQEALTQEVMRMLPKGYEGKADEVQKAVSNATMTGQGGVKLFDLIRDLKAKGVTTGQIATVFEGRHVARYTPLFAFYDKMIETATKLHNTDGSVMDAVTEARKNSEAGQNDALSGSWQNLMIKLRESGGVIDAVIQAVTKMNNALANLPNAVTTALVGAGVLGSAAIGGAVGLKALRSLGLGGKTPALVPTASQAASGRMIAGMAAAGAGGAGWLSRVGLRGGLAGGGKLLSRMFWPAMLLGSLYGAGSSGYDAYAKGQGGFEIIKRALLGALMIDGQFNDTGAAGGGRRAFAGHESLAAVIASKRAQASLTAPAGAGAAGGESTSVASDTLAAVEQMRAELAAVDLTGDGQRIGASLAAGLRSSLADAVSAVREAGASIRAEASKIQLNTGPAMGGAR